MIFPYDSRILSYDIVKERTVLCERPSITRKEPHSKIYKTKSFSELVSLTMKAEQSPLIFQ